MGVSLGEDGEADGENGNDDEHHGVSLAPAGLESEGLALEGVQRLCRGAVGVEGAQASGRRSCGR